MLEVFIHKVPMNHILRCVVDAHGLNKALKIINDENKSDFTQADICSWKHIPKEKALDELAKLKNQ